ncbi:aspartate/glutamate racemase family protein [Pseudomonas massiliensis]|uniref:aspartate/glutamate racemase family protein n=1 Tax=Pseudomonas massiliensis TaxID=522492 RepID=UPI000590FAAC|nr:aspartate/glutamate racemase family protein [Pseudomonas massiliensis]
MSTKRIFLIHATRLAMDPVNAGFARLWPQARCFNLWDDSLSVDANAAGHVTPALTERLWRLAEHAVRADADGVLFTCSSYPDAIASCQRRYRIPMLKPNEAMVREALNTGSRIAALTTFGPAADAIAADFAAESAALAQAGPGTSATQPQVTPVLCEGALAALQAGDVTRHDELIAATAGKLRGHYDVLCLAQFSMSSAVSACEAAFAGPVLSSPDSAVRLLRALVEG